ILCIFMFSLTADIVSGRIKRWIDIITEIPMTEMMAGIAGLTAGLLFSLMINSILSLLGSAESLAQFAVSMVLGYMGLRVGLAKKEELSSFWKSGKWGSAVINEERKLEEHK